ncbi:MAG: hypothetical protein P1S60_17120, partial [Anaerolineae bacterium]|nr:hypothetical protein [Anaerolineae bacterium]
MGKPTDIRVVEVALYFLPVETRVPLKFGTEVLTSVTCARVRMVVEDTQGHRATGWGETPLSVQWVWPGTLPYSERHSVLESFCLNLAEAWRSFPESGHPVEVGFAFMSCILPAILEKTN